ncbi:hypothetical protein BAZ12_18660 [Elizabethkingia miricola]|uniref:DUF4178 domain-containing protein n=1 Tax=Elizabethkingia miricola TaxID=172045 RepID=A0ABD4DJ23_ELIMR|nr:hypothetical protein [Elizabethkingia miricola]KUY17156.1 hypothetical protein ATB95_12310 [Elizabethkingia miricola]OPC72297.1 hypothetical protein BAZ13_06230 [Elizabethkingia miricola]OPC76038.1 hypothetical protein BAZ12_18660 [Elizabethkingia miricola]SPW31945.1 Uncharacterised protein [Elizabethkingia miricola]
MSKVNFKTENIGNKANIDTSNINPNNKNFKKMKKTIEKMKTNPSKNIEQFSGDLFVSRIELELKDVQEKNIYWENFSGKSEDRYDYSSSKDFEFGSDYYIYFENKKWYFNIIFPQNISWIKDHYLIENIWVQQKNFVKELFNIDLTNSKISVLDIDVVNYESTHYISTIKGHSDLLLEYSDGFYVGFGTEDGKLEYTISVHTDFDGEESDDIYIERINLQDHHDLFERYHYDHFMNWDIDSHLKYFVVQQRNKLIF